MIERLICHLEELMLCLQTPICQSLGRVSWKTLLVNYDLMERIFQVVCTGTTAMTIINCKIWTLRPAWQVLLRIRSSHVQNNWNPVFIVIPLYSLVSVSSIRDYQSVSFGSELCILKIFKWIRKFVNVRGAPISRNVIYLVFITWLIWVVKGPSGAGH